MKNDHLVIAVEYHEIKLAVKIADGNHQATAELFGDACDSVDETF